MLIYHSHIPLFLHITDTRTPETYQSVLEFCQTHAGNLGMWGEGSPSHLFPSLAVSRDQPLFIVLKYKTTCAVEMCTLYELPLCWYCSSLTSWHAVFRSDCFPGCQVGRLPRNMSPWHQCDVTMGVCWCLWNVTIVVGETVTMQQDNGY